jgi:hypothetical protein
LENAEKPPPPPNALVVPVLVNDPKAPVAGLINEDVDCEACPNAEVGGWVDGCPNTDVVCWVAGCPKTDVGC